MKNWLTLEADENLILSKHYTPGRAGHRIDKIVVHHNAGNLTIQGCWNVWQTREASAHYQVDANGRIGQLVWDTDTAWHAGDLLANQTSIGIEHADINTSPWLVSDKTLDNGAHLVAALCHHYKLGRPAWLKNVYPHSHFSSTACPASLYGSQKDAYMKRAQYWYDQMSGKTTSTSKPTTTTSDLIEGVIDTMKATHIIFEYSGAICIADVLAGTWRSMPNPETCKDTLNVLRQAGAKVVEWGALRGKKGQNKVENPFAFGNRIM